MGLLSITRGEPSRCSRHASAVAEYERGLRESRLASTMVKVVAALLLLKWPSRVFGLIAGPASSAMRHDPVEMLRHK